MREFLCPEIKRPTAVSCSYRDFWIAYDIADALGLGQSTKGRGMGDVWFAMQPDVQPYPGRMHHATVIARTASHWGLDVLPAFLLQSDSLLVIVSANSAHSRQIDTEIEIYPRNRDVWFMPIVGQPVPERWGSRPNAKVVNPPIKIDVDARLAEALIAGAAAAKEGRHQDAYLFCCEALSLRALDFKEGHHPLVANLFCQKGTQEIRWRVGIYAVQSFMSALSLVSEMDGPWAWAMQAHILLDLGVAHQLASRTDAPAEDPYTVTLEDFDVYNTPLKSDPIPREFHGSLSRRAWITCLEILTQKEQEIRGVRDFPYDAVSAACSEFLIGAHF